MRYPLFMAAASGQEMTVINNTPMTYDAGEGTEFPSVTIAGHVFWIKRVLSQLSLPVTSNGTNGRWTLYCLQPDSIGTAAAKVLWQQIRTYIAGIPAGWLLVRTPAGLPAGVKTLLGGVVPWIVAGDDELAQILLEEGDM